MVDYENPTSEEWTTGILSYFVGYVPWWFQEKHGIMVIHGDMKNGEHNGSIMGMRM